MEDLEALEEWLYEDGEDGGSDAALSVYKEKAIVITAESASGSCKNFNVDHNSKLLGSNMKLHWWIDLTIQTRKK